MAPLPPVDRCRGAVQYLLASCDDVMGDDVMLYCLWCAALHHDRFDALLHLYGCTERLAEVAVFDRRVDPEVLQLGMVVLARP